LGVVVALLALIGGYLLQKHPDLRRTSASAALVGTLRPDYTLLDLAGKPHRAAEWDGKVVLVNFWATWCLPCREELPALAKLRGRMKARGVEIVGIALDDGDAVRDFLSSLPVAYPQLLAGEGGIGLMRAYGDGLGALPYSVVLDRAGRIAHQIVGPVRIAETEKIVDDLLGSAENAADRGP
jgi:thiol-disulfide isomerase/thioredoxin